MIRISSGLKNVPLFLKKVQNSPDLWRGGDFPRFLPGYKPANGVRRISAGLQARRHQSYPGRAVHVCVRWETPMCASNYSQQQSDIWKKSFQYLIKALPKIRLFHLEGQINQEIFPISLNLFGKSSSFQMEKVEIPPDCILLIRYWSVCLPVNQFLHLKMIIFVQRINRKYFWAIFNVIL